MKNALTIFTRIVSVTFILIILVIIYYLIWPPVLRVNPESYGKFNRKRNGLWLAHTWLAEKHTESEIKTLFDRLARRDIRFLYPHLCPMDEAGHLPKYSRAGAKKFVKIAHQHNPPFKVLPWVGGSQAKTVDLYSEVQRKTFVKDLSILIRKSGADGVHINIEPLHNYDLPFIKWLGSIKGSIGRGKMLSVAAYPPLAHPISSAQIYWDSDYYLEIAKYADQFVVMTYDTTKRTRRSYIYLVKRWTKYLLKTPWGAGSSFLMGIPTYENYEPVPFFHRSDIENIENALSGVMLALEEAKNLNSFDGVAIYANWETDETEWGKYSEMWLGNRLIGDPTKRRDE